MFFAATCLFRERQLGNSRRKLIIVVDIDPRGRLRPMFVINIAFVCSRLGLRDLNI